MRLTNTLFGTEPIVAHCPGPLSRAWRLFAEAVFEAPVTARPCRESATILTWNHGGRPDKPNGILEHCLERRGCPPLVLGGELKTWRNIFKLQVTADALERIETDYIIGLDSADVLVVAHPDEIAARFRTQFDCDLLFNATGSKCWPELPEFIAFESSRPEARHAAGRHWLNSGAFIGRTDFCRRFFRELAHTARSRDFIGDQHAIKDAWPRWYPAIQLDYECRIFQWFNEDHAVLKFDPPLTH